MAREVDTDLAVLERLTAPGGKRVLDVGCGGGGLVRALAELGAQVVGIEISEGQLAAARAAPQRPGVQYTVGRAEALPIEDASVGLVIFMRSLHHVPPDRLQDALVESRRVLSTDGMLYVVEPLPEGDYFSLTSLVEDELEVRGAAQRALGGAAQVGFERGPSSEYAVELTLPDLEALRRRIVSVDPDRAAVFAARESEIARAFRELGEPGPGGDRTFRQPMRADLLRRGA